MIGANTNILALDVDKGEPFNGTISDLFKSYPRYQSDEDGVTILRHPHLKLTDWTGWTDVTEIQCVPYDVNIHWFTVSCADQSIVVSDDELLVIYDKNGNPYHGFHGDVKFKYQLTSIFNINIGKLRIRNQEPVFRKYSVSTNSYFDRGYRIKTKSGFYNGNNFHMNGNPDPEKYNGYK